MELKQACLWAASVLVRIGKVSSPAIFLSLKQEGTTGIVRQRVKVRISSSYQYLRYCHISGATVFSIPSAAIYFSPYFDSASYYQQSWFRWACSLSFWRPTMQAEQVITRINCIRRTSNVRLNLNPYDGDVTTTQVLTEWGDCFAELNTNMCYSSLHICYLPSAAGAVELYTHTVSMHHCKSKINKLFRALVFYSIGYRSDLKVIFDFNETRKNTFTCVRFPVVYKLPLWLHERVNKKSCDFVIVI